MYNTTSAIPGVLPCFVCGTTEGNKSFSSRGHYPSTLLDDDGTMSLDLCAADLADALTRGRVRPCDEVVRRSLGARAALPCVKCGRRLAQYGGVPVSWRYNQPIRGLAFEAREHVLSACDECVAEGLESRAVHLVLDDENEADE